MSLLSGADFEASIFKETRFCCRPIYQGASVAHRSVDEEQTWAGSVQLLQVRPWTSIDLVLVV